LSWFLEYSPGTFTGELSDGENERIRLLAETKYRTWEWNYAYGPGYHFINRFEFKGDESQCSLFVKDGIITEIMVKGPAELEKTCRKLIGCKHMVECVQDVLEKENIFKPGFDIYNFF